MYVCGWLNNFSPALVPVAKEYNGEESDTEVQDYFNDSETEEGANDDDKI